MEVDAWVVGVHDLPAGAIERYPFASLGQVVVHVIGTEIWMLMTQKSFDEIYEWVDEDG